MLKGFDAHKNKHNTTHASKLIKVYEVVKALKKDIVKAVITEKNVPLNFGRHTEMERKWNGSENEIVKNEGTAVKADIFTIETKTGKYSFAIPTCNQFYNEFCDLLNIAYVLPEVNSTPLYSIVTDGTILGQIKAAAPFVEMGKIDASSRPAFRCLCIDYNGGKLQIVGTDAHKMYYSRLFDCELKIGGKHLVKTAKPFQIVIDSEDIKAATKIKTDSEEPLCINVFKSHIEINGTKLKLFTDAPYPNYRMVIPDYATKMEFDKVKFAEGVKTVKVAANKYSKQVQVYLNGCIELSSCDVDFDTENKAQMSYISKDFEDTTINFNGDFLLSACKAFTSEKLSMYTAGNPSRAVVFTDGNDSVLLMPQLVNYN